MKPVIDSLSYYYSGTSLVWIMGLVSCSLKLEHCSCRDSVERLMAVDDLSLVTSDQEFSSDALRDDIPCY